MSTLSEMLADHTELPGEAVDHLQRVVGEWQLLADTSFADLLLWVPSDRSDGRAPVILCVAQCRPTTAPTYIPVDKVGAVVGETEHPEVDECLRTDSIVRGGGRRQDQHSPPHDAVPVRVAGRVVAVLTRDSAPVSRRPPSLLEAAYRDCAHHLCDMIAEGSFPTPSEKTDVNSSPRVGDGFIRLDTAGIVTYASPNAVSAYHRMGLTADLPGHDLAASTRALVTDPFDAEEIASTIADAVTASGGRRMEVDARGATVLMRTLALQPAGRSVGALVLVRDVTEVKRRDRALLSKDATIREIHHRVKNNLQTVAALLRLQARRTENDEAKVALTESVRRVTSIALVHDVLSNAVDEVVDLDEVVDRLVPVMVDVGSLSADVTVRREGSLGVFPAERATPLVMVLTELVQNSLEHGFDPGSTGCVTIRSTRSSRTLDVVVRDDGKGVPDGFDPSSSGRLGLQIVSTLVAVELKGTITVVPAPGGGTDAMLQVPLGRRERRS
ncbi:ATPase [Rhodococcus sp. Leaf7]|uniref:sensor histidine kinase n=1 Tax=unclassified Rhodococcus (in: high G+C Gram-positive bacteria) TaxID=192944 RepID=UPI0006F88E59|nr:MULTISPECIES: sensor histidine kinase [unclassified Rhodococcus (in: high G+C Gram-positive bacteria)]KQU06265.1 ATPase [Rhodococcus sp. Leaf7]KQU41782.1 ATPase [Rhodococcus sp. Leaf247]